MEARGPGCSREMLQLVTLNVGARLAQVELACRRITGELLGVPCRWRCRVLTLATGGIGAAASCKLTACAAGARRALGGAASAGV